MIANASRLTHEVIATPVGALHVVFDGDVLCALDYDDYRERMHRLLRRRFGAYEFFPGAAALGARASIERYFDGDLTALDAFAVEPGGTPYQRRVWAALRTIPPGDTRSYGELAAQLGATHARAVGGANACNPIAIVLPCHRVIGADATLTGYAGGLERKRWLLAHEARHAGFWLPGI